MENANRLEETEHLKDPVGNGNSLYIYYVHTYFFTMLSEPQPMKSLTLIDHSTLN